MLPLVVVLDFDGTVTEKDVGDEVCDRFAPPKWREIDAKWQQNEISLPEAQRQMWALARATRAEALAYARQIGNLRPGLDTLLDAVEGQGGRSWLASGGFDFYIEGILGTRLDRFEHTYFSTARFEGGSVHVEFPHSDLACERCAVCKGRVCERARAVAKRVVFVGDGSSDRCAVGVADELYAVAGSLLARTCEERGSPYRAFRRLDEVAAGLAKILS